MTHTSIGATLGPRPRTGRARRGITFTARRIFLSNLCTGTLIEAVPGNHPSYRSISLLSTHPKSSTCTEPRNRARAVLKHERLTQRIVRVTGANQNSQMGETAQTLQDTVLDIIHFLAATHLKFHLPDDAVSRHKSCQRMCALENTQSLQYIPIDLLWHMKIIHFVYEYMCMNIYVRIWREFLKWYIFYYVTFRYLEFYGCTSCDLWVRFTFYLKRKAKATWIIKNLFIQ